MSTPKHKNFTNNLTKQKFQGNDEIPGSIMRKGKFH